LGQTTRTFLTFCLFFPPFSFPHVPASCLPCPTLPLTAICRTASHRTQASSNCCSASETTRLLRLSV
jgi:hypothetical protein